MAIKADNAPWVIYLLIDPRSGAVRYVGWTINLRQRVRDHLKPSQITGSQRRDRWLAQLVAAGLRPSVVIAETGVGDGWADAERRWIAHHRQNSDLTNLTDGGEGALGRRHTAEARAAMSAKRKGVKPSPLAAQRTKELMTGVPRPEFIAAAHAANKGRPKSPEHRAKLAASHTGMKASAETRAKMSAARYRYMEATK